jgi:pantothenate kinase
MGEIKAHAFTVLHLAIEGSNLIQVQQDKRERLDIKNVYLFKCLIQVDSDLHEMWLYIRERKEGMFLYSVNVSKEKTL